MEIFESSYVQPKNKDNKSINPCEKSNPKEMFASQPNYSKLKTNLRLAINRLKLLEKKKTELTQKARKEIADYIAIGKADRAKIRVEHIIREDYLVEAMEIVEMYCDLLLARFGLITQMKELDEGIQEAISSILWVTPRLQTDVQEMKVISEILTAKYGKIYADSCVNESQQSINEKLKHKVSIHNPPKILVERYLIEIANNYNVKYEPDPQVMREDQGQDALLIDIGGPPQPPGFIGYPNLPMPPPPPPSDFQPFQYPTKPSGGNAGGFYIPPDAGHSSQKPPPPMTYNIPPGVDSKDLQNSFLQEEMNNLPPAYDTVSPDDNLMNSNQPKPQPRSKFPASGSVQFPELPSPPQLPSPPRRNSASAPDEIDFEDLNRRFEDLKKKK